MPLGAITIEDHDVIDALTQLRRRTDNMQPVYTAIGRALKTRIQFGYRQGTDPYGTPWAKLAAPNSAGAPLRDKGNLRDAWDYVADNSQVELVNNRTVTYKGESHSLALIHHRGAVIKPRPDGPGYLHFLAGNQHVYAKKVTIPARPQIPDAGRGLPDDWREDVFEAIEGFMTDGRA